MLIEEIKTRERTGIAHLSDEVVKKLMSTYSVESKSSRRLFGLHTYDLLADRKNANKFLYMPYGAEGRAKSMSILEKKVPNTEVALVEKVRVALDLAYLNEAEAQRISFFNYDGVRK